MGEASNTDNTDDSFLKIKGLLSIEWNISKYNLKDYLVRFDLQCPTTKMIANSPIFGMGDSTWSLCISRVWEVLSIPVLRIALLKHSFETDLSFTCQMVLLVNNKEIPVGCKKTCEGEKRLDLCMDIQWEKLSPYTPSDDFKVVCTFYPEVEEKTTSSKQTSSNLTDEGIDILSSNMKDLFLKGENCDFVIEVKDRDFQVHKAILCSRSPVLSAMLHHDMAEKNSGTTKIEGCEPDVFERFLLYLYSGEVGELSWKNVTQLYTLGDKYEVPHLRKECLKFMEGNITIRAFCDAISLAVEYKELTLVKSATDFYLQNGIHILGTDKWMLLMKENPSMCNELFVKYAQDRQSRER